MGEWKDFTKNGIRQGDPWIKPMETRSKPDPFVKEAFLFEFIANFGLWSHDLSFDKQLQCTNSWVACVFWCCTGFSFACSWNYYLVFFHISFLITCSCLFFPVKNPDFFHCCSLLGQKNKRNLEISFFHSRIWDVHLKVLNSKISDVHVKFSYLRIWF